jgi:hypothetical protein
MKKFALSKEEYRAYQNKNERPRGAFASVWTPDDSPASFFKMKPEERAVAKADRANKGGKA